MVKMTSNHRNAFAFCLFLTLTATGSIIYQRMNNLNWPIIRSDGQGYYSYLPLYVIERALDFEKIAPHLGTLPQVFGFRTNPRTGRLANIYPIGTAVCILPFFLLTHAFVLLTKLWPADGYSVPYQFSVLLAALCYFALGIVCLWRFLSSYFSQFAVVISILLITFATSLFHYITADPSFSHVYTFSLVAVLLYLTELFWRWPSLPYAILLGSTYGLLFMIRNYNLIYFLILLHPLLKREGLCRAWRIRKFLLASLSVTVFTSVPQLLIWKYYFGSYLVNSYQIPLNFFAPELLKILFSVRKGVFFWSPVLLFGILGLAIGLCTPARTLTAVCLSAIGLIVYIVAIWPAWSFGSSFGHRAFVDSYPFFAIGLSILIDRTNCYRWRFVMYGLFCILLFVNLMQMWSYWQGILPGDGATMKSYIRGLQAPVAKVFGLSSATTGDSLTPNGLLAEVSLLEEEPLFYKVRRGDVLSLDIKVKNIGNSLWLSDPGRGGSST